MTLRRIVAGLILTSIGVLTACGSTPQPTAPVTSVRGTDAPAPTATALSATTGPTETPTAVPTPAGPRATVLDLINDVTAHALPGEPWAPAQLEMPIYVDGEVWAKESSTARLGLEAGVIRVAPNTIYTHGQPDPDTVELKLDEGQIWINVEGADPDRTFEVETPDGVASVRGTRFSVGVTDGLGTLVSTQVGTVTLAAAGAVVTVTAGLESLVPAGDVPEPPNPMSPVEQLRWGVAAGLGLDVVLPTVGRVITFTQTGFVSNPQLSPDGRYLTYYYYFSKGNERFYGSRLYDIRNEDFIDGAFPEQADGVHFSPQGDRISYGLPQPGEDGICTVPIEQWDAATCFSDGSQYGWPRWSPDGERLFFYTRGTSPGAAWNLYTARPDGTDLIPLSADDTTDAWDPVWSPDGAWIAYSTQPAGDYRAPGDVWIVSSDASEERKVFEGAHAHFGLAWSRDSSILAIRGEGSGMYLYSMEDETVHHVPGTEHLNCLTPVWSPTADGWPLLFLTWDVEKQAFGGLHYFREGEPLDVVNWPDSAPVWNGDGSRAMVGFVDRSEDVPVTTIYVVDNEVEFYP